MLFAFFLSIIGTKKAAHHHDWLLTIFSHMILWYYHYMKIAKINETFSKNEKNNF